MISASPRPSLLDLSRESLSQWLDHSGEEAYRAGQIQRWVHDQVPIAGMQDLPSRLRSHLSETFDDGYLPVVQCVEGEGADRFLFRLRDGEAVESVRIGPLEDYTACLSTQVGCGLRCSFCASGKFGWTRNLTAGEIVGQVLALRRETAKASGLDGWPRHLVYMGMGEPFQNYGATLESIRRLIDPKEINFGARRITISTAGDDPGDLPFRGRGSCKWGWRSLSMPPTRTAPEYHAGRGGLPTGQTAPRLRVLYRENRTAPHLRVCPSGWRE